MKNLKILILTKKEAKIAVDKACDRKRNVIKKIYKKKVKNH